MGMPRNYLTILRISLPFIVLFLLGVWPTQRSVGDDMLSARQAEHDGWPGLAAMLLRKIAVREPFLKGMWEQIGNAELAAGNPDAAEGDFSTALRRHELSTAGLDRLAKLMEGKGKWAEAAGVWEELAQEAPSDEVYSQLVEAYRRAGLGEKALAAAHTWQSFYPQDANASYIQAILLAADHPEEAQHQLDACSVVPRCRDALLGIRSAAVQSTLSEDPGYRLVVIGRWLGNLGEWDLAEEAFLKATGLSPGYAEAWAFLGQARLENGKDGLPELEKALQVNPDSVLTRALLAIYWGKNEQYDKAIEMMQVAARLEPKQAIWQVELGNLTASGGDLIAALAFFKKAEEIEPENPLVWQSVANFALKYNAGLRDQGLPAARKLVELRPDDPASLDLLGSVLLALGDARAAERILQQSISIDPTFAASQYHLGLVLNQLAENDQAVEHLKQAVKLDESGSVGKLAGRLLDQIQRPNGN
jgi:tetratricopeptide (TPR) repeat protein